MTGEDLLLAVSYPLSAFRRLVDGGKADSALPCHLQPEKPLCPE